MSSSKFDHKKTPVRYALIVGILLVITFIMLGRALYMMTVQRSFWLEVADRVKRDSVTVKPVRGNILSSDGQIMVSSLPEYMMYIDFKTMTVTKTDTLWEQKLDSITTGLHANFPAMSKEEFAAHLGK